MKQPHPHLACKEFINELKDLSLREDSTIEESYRELNP